MGGISEPLIRALFMHTLCRKIVLGPCINFEVDTMCKYLNGDALSAAAMVAGKGNEHTYASTYSIANVMHNAHAQIYAHANDFTTHNDLEKFT